MASKTFTLDADFDITDYPNLLTKSDNVELKQNYFCNIPGINDALNVDSLVTQCASYTTGCIAFGTIIDVDADMALLGICKTAGSTQSQLIIQHAATNDNLLVLLRVDGTVQWYWISDNGYMTAKVGTRLHIAVNHDGSAPTIWVNGVDVTTTNGSFLVSTDKTKWLKAIITDPTYKADNWNWGIREENSGMLYDFNGTINKPQVYSVNKSSAQIAALAAEDWIAGVDAPDDCVCNIHFRGDCTDLTGNGNDGTLVNNAAIIADSAGYSTESPETHLIETGNEYAIDAGSGNYVNVSNASDNETTPAGTSVTLKYAFSDSATRAGVSWSSAYNLSNFSSNANTASKSQKKRYMFVKELSVSDGSDTPTLDDLTINYTASALANIRGPFGTVDKGPSRKIA